MSLESHYSILIQPQLIEDAMLCALANHVEGKAFRWEKDRVYEITDESEREQAFRELYQKWFRHLALGEPLEKLLHHWPILMNETHRCVVTKASSPKDIGADLYVADGASVTKREQRSILIRLLPKLFGETDRLTEILRHELLHVVDMLDPHFGYQPHLPRAEAGPAHERLLQERYSVLWDIRIAGRLAREGWLASESEAKYLQRFMRLFPGAAGEQARMFSHFFDGARTHQDLLSFAMAPQAMVTSPSGMNALSRRCSLCHSPSFDLIEACNLPAHVKDGIRADFPIWEEEAICRQCGDLYEAKVSL